jgi:hydroxymethylpyrimidine/phosphomethylpyrimidine kinase
MLKPFTQNPPTILTIAGVDSGGGAGVAADLKTFAALGVHGACAIAALTAQNTQAVVESFAMSPEVVTAQLEAVLADLPIAAVKTGMLATSANVEAVYQVLIDHHLKNVVVDPVMVASTGGVLLEPGAKQVYRDTLMPVARVITPNVQEAEALLETRLRSVDDLPSAARELAHLSPVGPEAVIITGGHLLEKGEAADVLYERKTDRVHFLLAPALDVTTTHGTGCLFSAALATHLALGEALLAAAGAAKEFTTEAIRHGLTVGAGLGPVNPMWKSIIDNR